MPTQIEIEEQQALLAVYRRTLAHCLRQRAALGEAFMPPSVALGISDSRYHIQRIKQVLRNWKVIVEDHPDDGDDLFSREENSEKVLFRIADDTVSEVLRKQKPTIRLGDKCDLLTVNDIAKWFNTCSFAVYYTVKSFDPFISETNNDYDRHASLRTASIKYFSYSYRDWDTSYGVSIGLYHPFDKGYGHLNGRVLAARSINCIDIDRDLKSLQQNKYYVCEITLPNSNSNLL